MTDLQRGEPLAYDDAMSTDAAIEAILDAKTYLRTPDAPGAAIPGATFALVHYDGTSATLRWGDEHDGDAADLIIVNGITTRGYLRYEVRNGQWSYDGGSVQRGREHGFYVDVTDSMRRKLIETGKALVEDETRLDEDMKRTWALKNAARALQRAQADERDAEAKLLEAQTARQAAVATYGAALNAAIVPEPA